MSERWRPLREMMLNSWGGPIRVMPGALLLQLRTYLVDVMGMDCTKIFPQR